MKIFCRNVVIISLSLCLILAGCSSDKKYQYQFSGSTMGTMFNVKVVFDEPKSENRILELQNGTQDALDQVDRLMSTYKKNSEVSQINRLEIDKPLKVSDQTIEVLSFSQAISEQTFGYFDITVAPLIDLWGFGSGEITDKKPDQHDIESALNSLGWKSLSIARETSTLSKNKAVQIDLSAIAKGYAVDQVADYLNSQAIVNYMIEVGGELVVAGVNPNSAPWRLGIEQPDFGGRKAYTSVMLNKGGLATSGDYRNYFEQDGTRYSHTIDPRTGYPVKHKLASVSVIAQTCMEADALATALMVMGEVKGYQFALAQGISAYFIYREGAEFVSKSTPEFERFLN